MNRMYDETQVNDDEVYRYGLFILKHDAKNLILSLAIGVLLGCARECIVFTLAYMGLRRYMGGYHASKASVCIVMSIAMLSIASVLAHMLEPSPEISIVAMIVYLILYRKLPIETKNRPLDAQERDVFRRITVPIMVLYLLIAVLLINVGWLYNCILFAIISCECLSVMQVFVNLREKKRKKCCASPLFVDHTSSYSSD